jgi:hypothetical protein
MKELLIRILDIFGLAWWIEIVTEVPRCTYYFGPFLNVKDAQSSQVGYLEDIQNENAIGISVKLGRFKPHNLTVFEDLGEPNRLASLTPQTF